MLINGTPANHLQFYLEHVKNARDQVRVISLPTVTCLKELAIHEEAGMFDLNYKDCINTSKLTLCIVIMNKTTSIK